MVLSLVGFLICVCLTLRVPSEQQVIAEVHRFVVLVRYLQRKALLTGKKYQVTIDLSNGSYVADKEWCLAAPVEFGVTEVLGPPGSPHKKLTYWCTWRSDTVEIYPDGTLAAGALYFTDSSRSCLYAVTVDASELSAIRRYRYIDRWCLLE